MNHFQTFIVETKWPSFPCLKGLKVTDWPGAKQICLIKQGFNYQRKVDKQLIKSIELKFKVVKVFSNKVLMALNRPYKFVVKTDQIVFVSITTN